MESDGGAVIGRVVVERVETSYMSWRCGACGGQAERKAGEPIRATVV